MQADIDFPILELMKPGHRILFAPEVIYQKQQQSPNQSVFPPVPACSILWLLKQLEGKKKRKRHFTTFQVAYCWEISSSQEALGLQNLHSSHPRAKTAQ